MRVVDRVRALQRRSRGASAVPPDRWYWFFSACPVAGVGLGMSVGRPFFGLIAVGIVGMVINRRRQMERIGWQLLAEDAEREKVDGTSGGP